MFTKKRGIVIEIGFDWYERGDGLLIVCEYKVAFFNGRILFYCRNMLC